MRSLLLLTSLALLAGATSCGCAATKPDAQDKTTREIYQSWPALEVAPLDHVSTLDSGRAAAPAPVEARSWRPDWLSPFRARKSGGTGEPAAAKVQKQQRLPRKLKNATLVIHYGSGDVHTQNDAIRTKSDVRTKTDEKTKLSGSSSAATGAGSTAASSKQGTAAAAAPAARIQASSETSSSSGFPYWLIAVLVAVALLYRFRSAWLGVLFVVLFWSAGAQAQAQGKQLQISSSRHSFAQARRVESETEKAKRKNRRIRRRENRHGFREYLRGQRELEHNKKQREQAAQKGGARRG